MEEAHHNSAATSDDDEDYSMFGLKRSRIKRRTIIDEDDDEKENSRVEGDSVISAEKISGPSDNGAAFVGTDTVNRRDSEQAGMDKINEISDRLFDSDNDDNMEASDSDGSSSPSCVGVATKGEGKTRKSYKDSEVNSSVNSSVNFGLSSDIFDAESSDEEDCPAGSLGLCDNSGDHHPDTDDSRHDSDGVDESQMDPELLAKLKKMKGAARSNSKKRKSKTTAEDRMESYSQSQRMLRDSRVSLPYYEPEPKVLDDFLARASLKRMAYAGLNQAKDIQKAQIICDKLSSPNVVPAVSRQRATRCNKDEGSARIGTSKLKKAQTDDLPAASQLSIQQEVSLQQNCAEVDSAPLQKCDDGDIILPQKCAEIDSAQPQKCAEIDSAQPQKCDNMDSDNDELPDLPPPLSETASVLNVVHDDRSHELNTVDLTTESRLDVETENCAPSLQIEDKSLDSLDENESPISPCPHARNETLEQETASTTESVLDSSSKNDINVGDNPKDNLVSCLSPTVSSSTCSVPVSETPTLRTFKSSLLDRLPELYLPALPSLSGTPDGIIRLDDGKPDPVSMKPGLAKLMRRLVQHSSKNVCSPVQRVAPNIASEDKLTVTEDSAIEKAETDQCAVSKLDRLKQQLGVGMRMKRAEARHRRQQLFALENEEGFEKDADGERSNSEEEEEMTEGSDTDEEEDEEADYKLKLNAGGNASEDDNDYNPFVDNEADEDEEEDSDADVHLHFDVSEDEEEEAHEIDGEEGEEANESDGEEDLQNIDKTGGTRRDSNFEDEKADDADIIELCLSTKKKRRSRLESDEEDEPALESDNENTVASSALDMEDAGRASNQRKWSNEMTPMSKLLQESQQQSRFRIENSQSPDLYSTSGQVEDSGSSHGRVTDSLYRSQSQKFDVDSILKLVQTQPRTRTSTLSLLDDESNRDFGGSQLNMSAGKIFHDLASQPVNTGSCPLGSQEDNMKQLLGLCSGTFGPIGGNINDSQSSQGKSTQSFPAPQSQTDDMDVYDPFHVLSDVEEDVDAHRQTKRVIFSDSEDGDNKSDGAASDRDEVESGTDKEEEASGTDNEAEPNFPSAKFAEMKKKKKFMRNEFLEEEAELSGSEYDSDENLDLAEEDDVLEDEAGDLDLLGVSEDKLRDQVGKLHMKQLQDDDERQVMRYKEMYLQDGDLYSEGAGRKRNFRWKDIEHNSQPDLFGQHSDDEQAEDDEEVLWRKNRFEREKLVEEEDLKAQSNNSQVLKLGQFFVQRQESIQGRDQAAVTPKVVSSNQAKSEQSKELKKGSFLCRGKETLVRIAQMVKATRTGTTGKTSRNFIFQTVGGPDSQETETSEPVLPDKKRKAHIAATTPQASKKPKLISAATFPPADKPSKPQLKHQLSIFELIERT